MGLETGTYINSLNASNPLGTDAKSAGDDHIRLVKSTIKNTFPNVAGAVTPTHTELNYVDGVTSAIQDQLNAKQAAGSYQPLDAELTALAGLTSATNKVPMFSGSGTATVIDFLDEDAMTSNSATAVPSQQSVKAYADGRASGGEVTLTAGTHTNVASLTILTAFYVQAHWHRHLSGGVIVTPTATGLVRVLLTNFASSPGWGSNAMRGVVTSSIAGDSTFSITSSGGGTNWAEINFTASSTAARTLYFTCTYPI